MVLDIEGTTTPMSFVHETLFSYAREHLDGFVRDPAHSELVRDLATQFANEHREEPEAVNAPIWRKDSQDESLASMIAYAGWLMDRDRKSPALKALQGHIWAIGYRAGDLRGAVFADVPHALERWHGAGLSIAIYSSGSVQAQRLIFSQTDAGDLTPFISYYFDTAVGPKGSASSYARIAETLKETPANILFISDVAAELDAAHMAGWRVALAVRPDHFAPNPSGYEQVESFDALT